MMTRARRQAGFSLLEVLVAFSIMGLSLGVLYASTGSSARSVGESAKTQEAMVLAQSLLGLRDSIPETGWNEEGRSGDMSFRITSAPYPTPISESNPVAARLHEVTFHVRWDESQRPRELQFTTLLPQTLRPGIPGARR